MAILVKRITNAGTFRVKTNPWAISAVETAIWQLAILTWDAPLLDAPPDARDKFVEPYFRHAKPDQVVAILKAREAARLLIAIGKKAENRWHLASAQRWVMHYHFYVNDAH